MIEAMGVRTDEINGGIVDDFNWPLPGLWFSDGLGRGASDGRPKSVGFRKTGLCRRFDTESECWPNSGPDKAGPDKAGPDKAGATQCVVHLGG